MESKRSRVPVVPGAGALLIWVLFGCIVVSDGFVLTGLSFFVGVAGLIMTSLCLVVPLVTRRAR